MRQARIAAVAALVALAVTACPGPASAFPTGATFTISGHGQAHGVGLCMGGAIGRAQAGQSYLTIIRHYYQGTTIGASSAAPTKLRVSLGSYNPFTVTGSFRLVGRSSTVYSSAKLSYSGGQYICAATRAAGGTDTYKIAAGSVSGGNAYEMAPTSGWGGVLNVPQVRHPDYGSTRYTHFRGRIIAGAQGGKLYAVNRVRMEDYVKGIGEEPEDRPVQFLRVTALACRTYAAYRVVHKKYSGPFDLDDTADSQVYLGYDYEKRAPKLKAAVEATKGQYIRYKGAPILAAYFSNCGGHSESALVAWGSTGSYPYLTGVYCNEKVHSKAWCAAYHGASWHVHTTVGAFKKKLGVKGELLGFSHWRRGFNIQPMRPGPLGLGGSPRVYGVRMDAKPSTYSKTVTGYTVAGAYGLRNNWFSITMPPAISGLAARNSGALALISFTLGSRGYVNAILYNSAGKRVWASPRYLKNKGAVTISRAALSPGVYTVRVEARDVAGTASKPAVGANLNFASLKFTAKKTTVPTLALSRNLFGPTEGSRVPTIAVTFQLPAAATVALVVRDPAGTVRRTIASGPLSAGTRVREFNGRDDGNIVLPSGVYSVQLRSGTATVAAAVTIDSVRPQVTTPTVDKGVFWPGLGQSVAISFTPSETGTATLVVHQKEGTKAGVPINTLVRSALPGPQAVIWDGKDNGGAVASPWIYEIGVQVTDPAGNTSPLPDVNVLGQFAEVEVK
jgi:peptidoglycan hydrolase-like amidase